eukprot:m.343927 g.343927  ORF g.343927 m.343927 type:complete len:343 (+) comp23558_c0_seq1:125-1153(+)
MFVRQGMAVFFAFCNSALLSQMNSSGFQKQRYEMGDLEEYDCDVPTWIAHKLNHRRDATFVVDKTRFHGFGSQVNYFYLPALLYTLTHNKSPLLAFPNEWGLACDDIRSPADVLQAFTRPPSVKDKKHATKVQNMHVKGSIMTWYRSKASRGGYVCGGRCYPFGHILHELSSHLLNYTAQAKKAIDEVGNQIKLKNTKYIAVHMRVGDKLIKEAKKEANNVTNSSWWVQGIEKVASDHKLKDVYLASDNCSLMQSVAKGLRTVGLKPHHIDCSEKGFHISSFLHRKNTSCDNLWRLQAEIQYLSRGICFIGSFASNIPRLVMKLRKDFDCIYHTNFYRFRYN